MAKKILVALFKTFIISTIISIAAICVFYSVSQKSSDYGRVVNLVSSGAFLLNIILLIMALPSLFLSTPNMRGKTLMGLLFYFSGIVVFIITALVIHLSYYDRIVYLLAGGIFLVVHTISYIKTLRNLY